VPLPTAIRQLQLKKLIQGRLFLFGKSDHGLLDFRQGRHRLSGLVEDVATIHLTRSLSFKLAILGKRETLASEAGQIFLFSPTHRGMLMGGSPSGLHSLPSAAMEQKFDTEPKAEIRLEGRKVTRSDVTNDWGLRLQWEIKRDDKVIATPAARADASYEHRRHAGQVRDCAADVEVCGLQEGRERGICEQQVRGDFEQSELHDLRPSKPEA
jgi:hypothetical protein